MWFQRKAQNTTWTDINANTFHLLSSCIFSVKFPNYRHFSFLHLLACQADHTAKHETCNHIGQAPTKTFLPPTYWRGWPGPHVLWAPPETHIARRSPRGAEWEMEEDQWQLPLTGSKWGKIETDRQRDGHSNVWRWMNLNFCQLCQHVSVGCSVGFCTPAVPRLQTWFWLWLARLWGFQGELMKHAWVILSICLSEIWLMVLNNTQQL